MPPMKSFYRAIELICRYEGFSEKAYPDPETGAAPYTIGYGTQFYPDGSPVLRGHCCTKKKALQYLEHEVNIIAQDLEKINLVLDASMKEALISFVHSIGWQPFIYCELIDCIGNENWPGVATEISRWIFDENHRVIGGLIDRRREEIDLFLSEIQDCPWRSTEVLLKAFRNYTASARQVQAIRSLERNVNPYILAEFANQFDLDSDPWQLNPEDEIDFSSTQWD